MQDYPQYIVEDIDRHGNVRVYFRRKGQPKHRFKARFPSPEWWGEYHAALLGASGPKAANTPNGGGPGTFQALCTAYQASAEFKRLNEATRNQRRRVLNACCLEPLAPGKAETFAAVPMIHFDSDHVTVLRDRKLDAPEAANHRIKTLRRLFHWAIGAKQLKHNPARDVERFSTASEGHHTWTQAELSQFVQHHPPGTKAHLALALFYFTGQRISDVYQFGPKHVVGDELIFTQAKNAGVNPVTLTLPILPELKTALDAVPKGQQTFLVNEWKKPFTLKGFGQKMRQWCDEAGLTHCSAHGIRKSGATTMAENAATHKQMMSVFGWRNEKQASDYIRKADQKRLAAGSISLLKAKTPAAKTVPLSKSKESGTTNNE